MRDRPMRDAAASEGVASHLKNWIMVVLTLIFSLLYAAALLGWIKPLADEKTVAHLEPIIFVIIGYYFGRLPAQQNEQTLKSEVTRQTQRADAAQHAKEQVQQVREALEEKIKNARVTLASPAAGAAMKEFAGNADEMAAPPPAEALRQRVLMAVNILNS